MNRLPAETRAAFRTLGLNAQATPKEIKTAYKTLARKLHPDRNNHNPYSTDKFVRISAAYKTAMESCKPKPAESGFASILGNLFRPSADKCFYPTPVHGKDIETEVSLSFMEAIRGGAVEVKVLAFCVCGECWGEGCDQPEGFFSCPKCQGAGNILEGDGGFLGRAVCPKCLGHGRVLKKCGGCHGAGRVEREKKVQITIPAGVDGGDVLTFAYQGHAGAMGGANGALHVRIRAGRSSTFSRHGMDIYHEATLPFTMAVFGGKIIVPTLDGDVQVTVPPGLKVNTLLRLKGRGALGKGSQFVRPIWEVPTNLSAREEELLREFARRQGHCADEGNWKNALMRLGKAVRLV